MDRGNRNTAFLFIGAGLYLVIGHLISFISAGAVMLAILGLAIVRSDPDTGRKDISGYILLGVAGLILLANHWTFLVGIAIAALVWFFWRTRQNTAPEPGAATGTAFMKQHIAASIHWGRGEPWTARSSEVSVAIAEIQIDMMNAIFEHPDISLNLQGLIGDIDIVVPEDVGLSVDAQVSIGEIQVAGERGAGFMNRFVWRSPNYETAEHRVQLSLSYLIADVKVKVL